jgi:AraC-like DNA-binding protein
VNESLSDFVECVYIWQGNPEKPYTIESPPNAYGSLVFNFGDPYTISTPKLSKRLLPPIFIAGQSTRNYKLHLMGKIGMVGIVFKPTGLYHFFRIPMREIKDDRIEVKELIPTFDERIMQKISLTPEKEDKIKVIQNYLETLKIDEGYATPAITSASNKLLKEKGNADISNLVQSSYMSRRTFERKFTTEVGVTPKFYAKVIRFGYVCSMIAGQRAVNFTDLLFKAGYYDQSHFIKDFKYFAGKTPQLYSKTNNELAHFVKSTYKLEQID